MRPVPAQRRLLVARQADHRGAPGRPACVGARAAEVVQFGTRVSPRMACLRHTVRHACWHRTKVLAHCLGISASRSADADTVPRCAGRVERRAAHGRRGQPGASPLCILRTTLSDTPQILQAINTVLPDSNQSALCCPLLCQRNSARSLTDRASARAAPQPVRSSDRPGRRDGPAALPALHHRCALPAAARPCRCQLRARRSHAARARCPGSTHAASCLACTAKAERVPPRQATRG